MGHIVLSEEQLRILKDSGSSVEVRDPLGNSLGLLRKYPELTPEEIAELKRRAASEPRYSSKQVFARLRALKEEWDRVGGFDEKEMKRLLHELRAKDGQ